MARWKLATSHYLNTVKPTKWRYSEQTRGGELLEKEFIVPRLLDIRDPKCWTNRFDAGQDVSIGGSVLDADGEIIVCYEGKGEKTDIAFVGDPTPDMIPLDEEAEEISRGFTDRWAYKPDMVSEVSHSQSLIDRSSEIMDKPLEVAGLTELAGAIGKLAESNQAILDKLSNRRF